MKRFIIGITLSILILVAALSLHANQPPHLRHRDGDPVLLCLTPAARDKVQAAFREARASTGPADGCVAGLVPVRLDRGTAEELISTLVVSTRPGHPPKRRTGPR